ncbi:hypothetical protein PR003_g24279 [Phytophthora rubi]|uniref:Uncharacterized protein n=1 Tax=Phytophthora rubi TaxID=129364 RepID=A0A6A3ITE5_9STRA|nr:hypothetical protein PR001_g23270 [Phytophthora rubi]KAE9294351.1 hypothetical protein PR003_g24279 [Phytophthora rubi]
MVDLVHRLDRKTAKGTYVTHARLRSEHLPVWRQNFLTSKEGLKAGLRARKCWKILIVEETKPEKDGTPATKKKRKQWRKKVLLLNEILTNTLDDVTRVRLAHLNKHQAKWAALVDDFEKKSFAVASFKRRELLNVEFDPDSEYQFAIIYIGWRQFGRN